MADIQYNIRQTSRGYKVYLVVEVRELKSRVIKRGQEFNTHTHASAYYQQYNIGYSQKNIHQTSHFYIYMVNNYEYQNLHIWPSMRGMTAIQHYIHQTSYFYICMVTSYEYQVNAQIWTLIQIIAQLQT